MNGRNGPLSPVSIGGGSEWSVSKYQNDTDSVYSPNPLNNRGNLASPPISSGSNGTMNGFPPAPGSPGGPSPPASIARSSIGTNGRKMSMSNEQFEAILSEHYVALKKYLAQSLRDEKGNPRPNRARDKLLRLSSVQFQELSTDVFDELLRRQQNGRRTPNGADNRTPPYLLPEKDFHPKRNQARQKLSTLPPPRFRDLATDVFFELERRFPRFAGGDLSRVGSPANSMRGPPSRNGASMSGAPRGMRPPSDASSIAGYSTRSESRNGPRMGPQNGGIPPSPGIPPGDFGRPTPKTFQSNTLVPNKSTMVEDDDEQTGGEDDEEESSSFNLEGAAGERERKMSSSGKSSGGSETDKKLIDDYQQQVAELREKLDAMEDTLKQKDDELANVLDEERNRSTTLDAEKKEWADLRVNLENAVADAQNLNDTLQSELDRVRASQAGTERELRAQIEELRTNGSGNGSGNKSLADADLQLENEELRAELMEQQKVTDEVRRDAQNFLKEMRVLSERSGASYEREEELTNTINRLEHEVQDWRNRYARTKTQLRTLRASSIGLSIQQDASKYTRDSGFTEENGLVKDVHVTKFQISIDELLQVARADDTSRVTEFMKAVIVNVRNITQDIDDSPTANEQIAQERAKLKSRISGTANNLITATKNYAGANGLSPVSLLDAAASHLTLAVVELVRTVKIRPTPAGELEDDDDGMLAPVDKTGFFPVRDPEPDNMAPPPIFMGLRDRSSADSSMYSPINSPRESRMSNMRPRSTSKGGWSGRPGSRGAPNGLNVNKSVPSMPMGTGFGIRTEESDVEELKIYLEDQTAVLVQTIQALVSSIRSEGGITAISNQITAIAEVVGNVVSSTQTAMSSTGNSELRVQAEPILDKLNRSRRRLIDAGQEGRAIADEGRDDDESEREWRAWTQSLPPIAFEIARDTKELVLRVDIIDGGGQAD
ncbi:hypothetical protein BP5796_03248 [Coleophoma crateriformis]|uniref:GIT Spa2 homology (SHD) domain-containing protein n=1 Tax=Coleophoma crateriformis TaxID=565419 RepID=A0A3D8SMZ7_9HELO|nr:hypothetical protein BP5796_03248 [Coleophoma crateriformis]